jgi:hypothetical protein
VIEKSPKEDIWLERDEVTGDWRLLHNEELHNLYLSTRALWVIKTRPILLAARSKTRVSGRSIAGIAGSNSADMVKFLLLLSSNNVETKGAVRRL